MSNAMKAARQHVEQETPHELADVEAHDFALVSTALPIVLPAETDVGLVEIEQAAVGDRDAMRIAREIGQDLLGTGEGLFGIDDPFGRSQWCEVGSELVSVKNCSSPAACMASRPCKNKRRNRRESTRTGRKKPGLQAIHRLPSGDMPPPGTIQCT